MERAGMSKEMLQAILGAIDEGIHAVDASGFTIYYNEVAARLDGMQVEEVLGKHLLKVFPSLNVQTSTLLKVIENQEPIYNQHQRYTNMKGKQVITVNTTLPIIVGENLFGAVEVSKDFSKVKELSEKLLDLQAQIAAHSKPRKNSGVRSGTGAKYHFTDIITSNREMQQLIHLGKRVASTSSPILIMGETGTGKELLVQSIHNASQRSSSPFIAQNCAALPDTLLEGLLFGTTKGSFTGAEDRPGLFELANGGSLFLDEINSMPLELQAKLLRVIQESQVRRVGASKEVGIDVRVMAALNEDPQQAMREGRLRTDLYYRLNVVPFNLPPLRERKEDILQLTEHFIKKFNYLFGKLVTGVEWGVEQLLMNYNWPGNIRELEHCIEAAMNLVEGDVIRVGDIPVHLQTSRKEAAPIVSEFAEEEISLREALYKMEEWMIKRAMEKTGGNVMQAAKQLGIPRQTLQYKLAKLGLS
ncbi:MAG TPA: sigma 54-interacting transcriptional regulator [Bacillota bacterium]|nr:sigma 54-interacting transcriptional regulator [Bacillota bacterium]